jgi:hypothetical protein
MWSCSSLSDVWPRDVNWAGEKACNDARTKTSLQEGTLTSGQYASSFTSKPETGSYY